MAIFTLNIESGMPSVSAARGRLTQGLRTARAQGVAAVKVIHGYGSTGKGGAIKEDAQRFLAAQKRAGRLREVVPGDRFTPFEAEARRALDLCPELARDADYARGNSGITIVLL